MPFFSIVIPAYNRAATIADTLNSVALQTFRDFECILVDDGSTDNTQQIASEFDFVQLISQNNSGPGAARNAGIKVSTGQFVAFLDSDDLWFPWTLETYHRILTTENCQMLCGESVPHNNICSVKSDSCPSIAFIRFDNFLSASEKASAFRGTPGLVVQRQRLTEVHGFTNLRTNAEDQDLCLRLGCSDGFVAIGSPPIFIHREHQDRISCNASLNTIGCDFLIQQERSGQYPGGKQYAQARRAIITALGRSLCMSMSSNRQLRAAMRLYLKLLRWHMADGRWKFVLGFPIIVACCFLRSKER
jgi:cellulose synthase/poly-beta-1,6-N-acetylglucosamine synthase-like glycosyltransferase